MSMSIMPPDRWFFVQGHEASTIWLAKADAGDMVANILFKILDASLNDGSPSADLLNEAWQIWGEYAGMFQK